LETSVKSASQIVLSVTGGKDLELSELNTCGKLLHDVLDTNFNMIFGADLVDNFDNEVQVIIIATGFPSALQPISTTTSRPVQATTEENSTIPVDMSGPVIDKSDENLPLYIRKLRKNN
jgi:cell division GTPase FtsZ